MNKRVKKLWVEALRSRRFKQGRRSLHQPEDKTHCCLGVLCELFFESKEGKNYSRSKIFTSAALPDVVIAWADLPDADPEVPFRGQFRFPGENTSLAFLNDVKHWPFYKIAAKIEKYL